MDNWLFIYKKTTSRCCTLYDYKAAYNRTKAALYIPGALKGEWPPVDGLPICHGSNKFHEDLSRNASGDAAMFKGNCGGSCDTSKLEVEENSTKICSSCGEKGKSCKCAFNTANKSKSMNKGICIGCGAFANQCVCNLINDNDRNQNKSSSAPPIGTGSSPSLRKRKE